MSRPILRPRKICCAIAITLMTGCGTGGIREKFVGADPPEGVITVDPNVRFQTMAAREATAQAGQEFSSFPQYQDMHFSNVLNDRRINRTRVELRGGA